MYKVLNMNIEQNELFIGRKYELAYLNEFDNEVEAKILIVHGRRRVGKTKLLEYAFKQRNLIKLEGLEDAEPKIQMKMVLHQLASYFEEPLIDKIEVNSWVEVLEVIAEITKYGVHTIYFEEVQWLANYSSEFISALKYAWDNFFSKNPKILVILCGSSPSFMINTVIKSKALYNRSQYELPLKELNLIEARQFLINYSLREVMDAYMTMGGIPEYLKRLKTNKSIYLTICQESFVPGAFFCHEYSRIFTSSLADNPNYKKIIDFLSKRRFATRNEILKHLKLKSGGALTDILQDLIACGFIEKYTPYNLSSNSLLARYSINDPYLQFYYKFIAPIKSQIENGDFKKSPSQAINMSQYQQWLGYSFERFCRKYHRQIATLLGFASIKYKVGSYFSRSTDKVDTGFQFDLVFDRADNVVTLCECKYVQSHVSVNVISEFEKKLELFPNKKNKTIQKVLISNNGAESSLANRAYFDSYISLEDLFSEHIW